MDAGELGSAGIAAIVLAVLVVALIVALIVSVVILLEQKCSSTSSQPISSSSSSTSSSVSSSSMIITSSSAPVANIYVQQGTKLVGTPNNNGNQGNATSMSGDGNTFVVGAPVDSSLVGAAFVFEKVGSSWTQTAKLIGSGATGNVQQGFSVAISKDGNTIAIGSNLDDNKIGAAWIFVRSGSSWVQQGSKLVGMGVTGVDSQQGQSLALSGDGNTLAVGGITDNSLLGATWIFVRSGTTWSQQGLKLVGSGFIGATVFQGFSVSLSSDGNTLAIGAPADNSFVGAFWIWTRSGTTWTQIGSKNVGTGFTGTPSQGFAIALSGDGNSLVESGNGNDNNAGAFWYYKLISGVWTETNSPIVGPTTTINTIFGNSLAINFDGTVLVTGTSNTIPFFGACWIFENISDVWTYRQLLTAYDSNFNNTGFGVSVGMDNSGNTIAVGGIFDDLSDNGASWVFVKT